MSNENTAKKSATNAGLRTKQSRSSSQTAVTHVEFSGPLPPPGMLEAYERVVPGSAERLLKMAEKEQSNVHRLRSGTLFSAMLGQILSAVLFILLVAGSVWLLIIGSVAVGSGLLVGTAVMVVLAKNLSPNSKK